MQSPGQDAQGAGPARRRESSSVVPLTCYQVANAQRMQGDVFKSNERVLSYVTVVGQLKQFREEGNDIILQIQDLNGYSIESHTFLADSDKAAMVEQLTKNEALPPGERKAFARVTGHVRSHQGTVSVFAIKIALVQYFEEVMAHALHCSYALLYAKRGCLSKPPPRQPGSVEATPPSGKLGQDHSPVGVVPPPGLQSPQDTEKLHGLIMSICVGEKHRDEIVAEVQKQLGTIGKDAVCAKLASMLKQGDLYNGKNPEWFGA
eukprot:TRINITY_DN70067_c0_g1_i1.p1 TRINITY_DN70067_c0_g1~~TRINITY_DN70067_c0_g1_i1.p1  ORF type:complete len:262 (+),score=93.33 TRINITY_DN70067_c0_g1_i1:91-876(+)